MRRAWLLLVVFGSGCAQLFGIDPTSSGNPPPPPDGPPVPQVSLSFERISIGSTTTRAPQDLTGQTATYVVPDTTDPSGIRRVTATQTATDTWTAQLHDAAPILFTLPDYPSPIDRIFDFPVADVHGLYGVLEHPGAVAAPANAQIAINVGLNSAYNNEGLQLYTVGSWTQRGFGAGEIPAVGAGAWAVTVAFSSVGSLTGRPLEQVTTADAVLLLRYSGATLTGVLDATPFNMAAGTNAINGTLSSVSLNQPLSAKISPGALPARFNQVRPATGNLSLNWSVVAAPGYQINSNAGPALTSGAAQATDTMITASYGNPFIVNNKHDWPSVFTYAPTESRTYTPAGQALAATMYSQLFVLAYPTGTISADLAAGLPITITANGKPLTTDGATLTVDPTKAVSVSFQADVVDNTLYQLQLFELVPNAQNTALQYQTRLSISSARGPQFLVPPEMFQTGKNYVFRAICISGGYPLIAQGDLRTRSLPQAVGLLDGAVFTVVAP
jgi:hypothetical protein